MKKIIKLTAILASIATISSGCSVMKQNEAVVNAAMKKTENAYKDMDIKKPDSFVTHSKEIYLAKTAFKIEKKQQLPAIFSKNITYTTAADETLAQTLAHISKMLGIEIRFTTASNATPTKDSKDNSKPTPSFKNYHGSLEKVLTEMTSKEGLFWSYEDNIIKVFSVQTNVYSLDAPIGSYTLGNSITSSADSSASSGSGSSGGQGTTTGSSTVNMNYNTKTDSPWSSAITTIKSMLSPAGHLDQNPVEGYVTITDNPERQREISRYITKINDKTNKKIAIRIDVYDVQDASNSNHGFDINAVTKALGGQVSWISHAQSAISDANAATNQLVFKKDNGDHDVIFKALNTVGKTTQITGTTVYTISGQPAPLQNSIQQNYLRSMSTTTSGDAAGTTTSSMDPGTITTGYSMTVTPRIESTNEILIGFNLQLSTLTGLTDLQVGDGKTGQKIQLPTVHTKSFLENMILRSGQTILIAGFQDDQAGVSTDSIGNPNMWLLGGSKATNRTKSTTVVVMTPYVIN